MQDFADEKQGDALNAMNIALALEKLNFEKITGLSEIAEKNGDPQFSDFIDEMLQVRSCNVKVIGSGDCLMPRAC